MLIMPIIVITVVVGIITLLSVMISKKSFQEMEKMSPIECGMMMMSSPRPPFSLQFFLLAILFLIFDVEIALILPLPLITPYSMSMLMISASIFMLILILGILYEWINGALEWNH